MKIYLELLRADFLMLLRGRVGMFWTLAFPALMLVMQMTLFGGSAALGPINIAIVNPGGSVEGQQYAEYLEYALQRQTAVRTNISISSGPAAGEIVLTVPNDFAERARNGLTSRIQVTSSAKDLAARNAVLGLVRGITDAYNIEELGKPRRVSLDIRQSADDRPRYTLYVVTGLAGMITLSTSLMGFAPVLVSAREGGMFKMYRLFPMWRGTVLLVWITSRLILTLLATVLMFALAGLLYKLQIAAPFAYSMAAIALLAVGVFAFLSVGLLIATWSASVSTATMLANLLYFPLLFSGNVMIPVSGLPGSVRSVLEYFPLNALVANMRDLLNGSFNLAYFIYTAALLITLSTACLYRSFRDSQWLARG